MRSPLPATGKITFISFLSSGFESQNGGCHTNIENLYVLRWGDLGESFV